jgi:hypothetical protein
VKGEMIGEYRPPEDVGVTLTCKRFRFRDSISELKSDCEWTRQEGFGFVSEELRSPAFEAIFTTQS